MKRTKRPQINPPTKMHLAVRKTLGYDVTEAPVFFAPDEGEPVIVVPMFTAVLALREMVQAETRAEEHAAAERRARA